MNTNVVSTTWTFCALFFILVTFGFISDLQPTDKVFLETNTVLNITHLITALGFAFVSKQNNSTAIQYIRIIGMAYMIISFIGFMGVNILIGDQWEDVIFLNLMNYIQFILGIALSIFGSIFNKNIHHPVE